MRATGARGAAGVTAIAALVRLAIACAILLNPQAIDAFLGALQDPLPERLEKRLQAWFTATERYPRQLHETSRAQYLDMKRSEHRRQQAGR